MSDRQAFSELCLVSRQGVCLLDMKQVSDKAKEIGLQVLPGIIDRDLEENKIVTGEYYPLVAQLLGVQS